MNIPADKTPTPVRQPAAAVAKPTPDATRTAGPFVDNRPAAAAQRKLQQQVATSPRVEQVLQRQAAGTAPQPPALTPATPKLPAQPVAQLGKKWTDSKVEAYKEHLRQRAQRRKEKGKRKNSNKLLRKYINARKKAHPSWEPHLADAPVAGHHVPPLALSNRQNAGFEFGKRGSAAEKDRERLYLEGTEPERREQHWLMHEAEGMQGVNRSGAYDGDAQQLAQDMVLAHHGLQSVGGTRLTAAVLNQTDRKAGVTQPQEDLGTATRRIMEEQSGLAIDDVESDDSDSGAESDEDKWMIDSDDDA